MSIFQAMEEKRDLVSWGTMISAASAPTAATLFLEMLEEGSLLPNEFCYSAVVKACSEDELLLGLGLAVFGHVIKTGNFGSSLDVCLGCALIDLFANDSDLDSAKKVFERMPRMNVVAWTQMIARSAPGDAVDLFLDMEEAGFLPDQFTLSSVISAATEKGFFQLGRQLHGRVIVLGLSGDVYVGCSLVDMYGKAAVEESISESRKAFDRMREKNVMTWTAIISAYSQRRLEEQALDLFSKMMEEGEVKPNEITLSAVLRAAGNISNVAAGEQIYTLAVKTGVASVNCLGNAFVSMYARSGRMGEARRALDNFLEKNLNTGISYLTLASLLSAVASVGATSEGKQLHAWLMKSSSLSDLGVFNSLISMYSKCGDIADACKVFDRMISKNIVSWTAMIGGLAKHGFAEKAVFLFEKMLREGLRPNEVAYTGVLSACAHAGMEEQAWRHFYGMSREHGISPRMEHYACMVDLLGRSGRLEKAVEFISEMPVKANALVWRSLLGACKIYGEIKIGEKAAMEILELEPSDPAAYVLLSNIYASTGRWNEVAEIRRKMKERKLRKEAGLSWIEIGGAVHEFHAGDTRHVRSGEIYEKLDEIAAAIKEIGYEPDLSADLHDVEEELKERFLFQHSEKIAVAFGLISADSLQPLRVFKNLRICGDCHRAIKLISEVTGRTIIIRDANRFHRFERGLCSCRDYW